jgi:hypothetical protein
MHGTYLSHEKKVRKYPLLRDLLGTITTASSGGENMKREVKKIFDRIHFVTDYKRDGVMKDYMKETDCEDFQVRFHGPYEVEYDLTFDGVSELTTKMVHQCGLRDLKIGKIEKTITITD